MVSHETKSGEDLNLGHFLAQTFVVYMKTYALHWNYEGPKFHGVHMLTEKQYMDMADAIDEMAERMRAMGHVAPISLNQILKFSSIEEFKTSPDGDQSIKELVLAHRSLSTMARKVAEVAEKSKDVFTHDMLIQRSGVHDKFAWMLGSLISMA